MIVEPISIENSESGRTLCNLRAPKAQPLSESSRQDASTPNLKFVESFELQNSEEESVIHVIIEQKNLNRSQQHLEANAQALLEIKNYFRKQVQKELESSSKTPAPDEPKPSPAPKKEPSSARGVLFG